MREMLTCFANQNSYISSLDKGLINAFQAYFVLLSLSLVLKKELVMIDALAGQWVYPFQPRRHCALSKYVTVNVLNLV